MQEFISIWFREIIIALTIVGVIGISSYLINSFRRKAKVDADIHKKIWRISKAVIVFAKLIDSQIEQKHPDVKSELEDVVKEIIESNGD